MQLNFRAAAIVAICVSVAPAFGCAAFRHGYTFSDYRGQVLNAQRGPGATRLEIEANYDPALRIHVGDKGDPDYIVVADLREVALVYIERDEIAWFTRPRFSNRGLLRIQSPIPGELLRYVDEADRSRAVEKKVDRAMRELGPSNAQESAQRETITDGIEQCYAIPTHSAASVSCDVGYVDGILSMVIEFESREAADNDWESVAGDAVSTFCAASNQSNRASFVYLSTQDDLRAYSCELDKWHDWQESQQTGSST